MLLTRGLRTIDGQNRELISKQNCILDMPAMTTTLAILFHLDHSLGLYSVGRSSIRSNCWVSAGLGLARTQIGPHSSALPFLIPSFLEQWRLLIIVRHIDSSQIVQCPLRPGERTDVPQTERNARVKHNQHWCQRPTKFVMMGNAHTHQLVGCESELETRLVSVIDALGHRSGSHRDGRASLTHPINRENRWRILARLRADRSSTSDDSLSIDKYRVN